MSIDLINWLIVFVYVCSVHTCYVYARDIVIFIILYVVHGSYNVDSSLVFTIGQLISFHVTDWNKFLWNTKCVMSVKMFNN
jgi:hypothetical protein